jgi:ribosome-binding protein aMBF1 (putative translation factor)
MAKQAAGSPSISRAKRAAKATPSHLKPSEKDTITPSSNGTTTLVATGGPANSAGASVRKASVRNATADDAPTDLLIIFGENLRAARLKRGFNQRKLAALSGLPQQYLSQIEIGQQNITLRTVEVLAKEVDHDVSTLLRRAKRAPEKK